MSPQNIQVDDLERRSKALDLREALLNDKERKLDETEATARILVLDKQIEAKRAILDKYNDNILIVDDKYQAGFVVLETKKVELENLTASKEKYLATLEGKKYSLESELTRLRTTRDDVKQEIRSSQDYLKSQEETVNETIATWNAQLTGFQQEANEIQDGKVKMLEDSVRVEQRKIELEHDIEGLQDKLDKIASVYEDKVIGYRADLEGMDTQLNNKNKELYEINILQDIRERNLAGREKAVKVKEVVTARNERELAQKERKLRGDYNRAGLDFDEAI